MRVSLRFVVMIAIMLAVAGAFAGWFILKREVEGPVSVETVSDDGFLKLVMTLKKTKFTINPREPVEINLTLINIGNQEITLTFHYKTKFDFMVYSYTQGDYTYMYSWEHVQGAQNMLSPGNQEAWNSVYNYSSLEPPEIEVITLKPRESISQLLVWNQNNDATGAAGHGWLFTEIAPKGKYRIEGYAGHGKFDDPWTPDNPLRYFEYTLPDGTLIRTVLKTPGIDITLT